MSLLGRLYELWRYQELIYNLVVRDLKVRYKNSILGVGWSLLNPLLMMVVFTIVFKYLAGQSAYPAFPAFILCALLPWNFFQDSVAGATATIVGNAHLIKKVYFPREVLPIALVLSNLVNFLIALPVYFVLATLMGRPPTLWALLLPLVILVQVAFTIGMAFILSTLNVFYRDTHLILGVVLLAWFFLTPVFYPINQVPEQRVILGVAVPLRVWLRRLNPMASIIASYRDILYWGARPGLDFFLRTAVTAFLTLLIGYLIFHHYSPRFAEEV